MKIAVCDDAESDRKKIAEYLKRYSEDNLLDFQIEEFSCGEELLAAFFSCPYKIIFLDIYMGRLSGIDVAYKIRQMDNNCAIILITTSVDHRADGFEIGAVHYLVKPVIYDGVKKALDRCTGIYVKDEKFISIISERKTVKIRMKDVLFAEVFGKEVHIHTLMQTYKTYTSLSDITRHLDENTFLNCHRCYIVNMSHIVGVLEHDFLLANGEQVPIRKNGRQKAKDEYSDYLFRSVRGASR